MAFDRILSFVLRAAELAFGAIVLGLTAHYLDHSYASAWANGRHIYALVVSCLAVLLSLLWLLPFTSTFVHWPVDLLISILWFVAFGLLVDLVGNSCGHVFNWSNIAIRDSDPCGRFKAIVAFAFLSAVCWLASAILGFFWTRRGRSHAVADRPVTQRRKWYSSRV